VKVGKKTPLTLAQFKELFELLPARAEGPRSWSVSRAEIDAKNYDLKASNPNAQTAQDTRTPAELLRLIEDKGRDVDAALSALRGLLSASHH
jgi:type I restriction enzyme M protein